MQVFKIALLGLGNIGSAVFAALDENRDTIRRREGFDVEIVRVLVRDVDKNRRVAIDPSLLTDRYQDILDDPEIQIIAEFIGGISPARDYLLEALRRGKSVVTANKAALADAWPQLQQAAHLSGAGLYFEASAAAAIPIVRALQTSLLGEEITQVVGIVNGTTNYILSRMAQEGARFEDVLRDAQALGLAEPDPTADVEGHDAACKLSILSTLAFRQFVPLESVFCEGISSILPEDIRYGKELGLEVKLLGIAKKDAQGRVQVRVHPTFIPADHPLASVRGAYNAVFVTASTAGSLMFYGSGAGDRPTASAILSDLINACRSRGRERAPARFTRMKRSVIVEDWESAFFVHLLVRDVPCALWAIAGAFGRHGVSLSSIIQKERGEQVVPVIFVTHATKESDVRAALKEIEQTAAAEGIRSVIRVEHLDM